MVEGAISVASPTMHPCQRRHQRFFRNPHTAAIQKLAADLGKNPHKIYQWVHDNIYKTGYSARCPSASSS